MKIAIENHCDLFADEVIWLVEQLNHPLIGACCDTINSLMVMEGIAESVKWRHIAIAYTSVITEYLQIRTEHIRLARRSEQVMWTAEPSWTF